MAHYYEPRDFDLAKGWFPFRNNHFVVNSEKVRNRGCFVIDMLPVGKGTLVYCMTLFCLVSIVHRAYGDLPT